MVAGDGTIGRVDGYESSYKPSALRGPSVIQDKVRVGLVGVGNCASSFVQGLAYYRDAVSNTEIPGLMRSDIGGYGINDIEVSAAFDVSAAKVGQDVSKAIFADPNNTHRFATPAASGVRVARGPTLDGIGKYLRDTITEDTGEADDVREILVQSRTNVLVS
jgi:myo-inositol-1-phosphate synthase